MGEFSNIDRQVFSRFLTENGYIKKRTNGGHEIWGKEGAVRPVVIQTHKDPIPEIIIRNNLKTMGLTTKDLKDFLSNR